MKTFPRTLLLALGFAVLLASLSAVIWRQSRALRDEATLLEARKAQLAHRIQELESRERVLAVAGARLNMRVPSADEIVFLTASRPMEVASR